MSLSKAMFRQQIWTYLEDNNIAKFPRPVFNRIPNFKGADQACSRILQLEKYQTASVIKVDPDSPLKKIRYLILKDKKVLLVPTPRLRYGLLNRISPPRNADQQDLEICATSEGVRSHSVKLDLDSNIKIDLVIVGAVAVKPNGRRIGKGEGYSDMEFAMMATLGAVSSDTTVVAVVHDCQVLDDIPDELFQEHDVPVDIIVTPSKVLYCQPRLKKPDYIMWPILSENKFKQIPILQTFKSWEDNKGFSELNEIRMNVSKDTYRQHVWAYLEDNNIAVFPMPVFNRIPNFKYADHACNRILQLREYQRASVIKVGPDSPLKKIRYLILQDKKVLLVPTPRLKSGLLNKITPPKNATQRDLQICSTSQGVRCHSVELDLDSSIKIDLVIVGTVAVKSNANLCMIHGT